MLATMVGKIGDCQDWIYVFLIIFEMAPERMRDRRLAALDATAKSWYAEVELVLRKYGRETTPLPIAHLYRLLTLKAWVFRYKVSLDFILGVLLQYYSRVNGKSKTGFGIGVHVLCGRKSQQLIEEAVLKAFPQGENVSEWKQTRQQALLPPPVPKNRSNDVKVFIKQYYRWVARTRRVHESAVERMQRRPWRDNPWR